MIKLNLLTVSQNGLRSCPQVRSVEALARDGFVFTVEAMTAWCLANGFRPDPKVISIIKFPNGMKVVHDGHHRCAGIKMSGRDFLYDEEYEISEATFDHYLENAPQNNWYTPIHPMEHCRLPDFRKHKLAARAIFETDGLEAAKQYIEAHRSDYCEDRRIWTVNELVLTVEELCYVQEA